MANFNLKKDIEDVEARIPNQNYALGKGLLQPFRPTNSGSRAVMQATQVEHRLPLMNPEPAHVMTGHENRYGEMSSNYIRAEANYVVIDKIAKYPSDASDTRQVYVIVLNTDTNTLDVFDRNPYEHVSESFGYLYDTSFIDKLITGDGIPKGSIISKTRSFDENNIRQDGLNLRTIYMACGKTIEDPVIVSESTAKRFASPLIDKVRIMVNDNDILLNLYGEGNNITDYKTFPNIGEEIKGGILCALRREKKEDEALFSQSWERLKTTMISDEPYLVPEGTVIDIDVYCNNPDALRKSTYNQQIYHYYQLTRQFAEAVVKACKPFDDDPSIKFSYALDKLYCRCLDICDECQYIFDKVFSNIIMDITVLRVIPLNQGDKVTDRYGGKGVVSAILPDDQMPEIELPNGRIEPVDIIYNKCTCVNRLNPGQLFETSVTYVGEAIVDFIYDHKLSPDDAAKMIHDYIDILVPEEASSFIDTYNNMSLEDKDLFIRSYIDDGNIFLVTPPMRPITLDTLRELYERFPFVQQAKVRVLQEDSNGNLRKVYAHRCLTAGFKHIYRLKQFAEEKFSAVSLAATNIRGENTKSKASKLHKILFSSTPVRFGEMEWEDLIHISAIEQLIQVLMLLSSSPGARRLCDKLLTGDPLDMDVKLDDKSSSRSAEIANAYLKTMGLKLVISKIPKDKKGAGRVVVTRVPKDNAEMQKVVGRVPFELTDADIDSIEGLASKDCLKEVVVRVNNCKTLEEAQQVVSDMRRSKATKLIEEVKDQYGCKTVDAAIKQIAKGVKMPKRVVGRIVAERLPNL